MPKYRIYSLIHGETLPIGKIFDCEIKKMNFDEQTERGFAPIQSVFSEDEDLEYYKTYVTSLPYVDPLRIRSEYVIVCDIEEDKPTEALGGAIRRIDRVTRFLSLACLEDVKRNFGRDRGSFEPYVYQVNKIYLLEKGDKERDANFQLQSGYMYLPNRPEFTDWRDPSVNDFLEEIFNFYDETLERALKYLYRSSIGSLILDSHEKIALDHFKSIEIIINSLSKKKNFKDRLKDASTKIAIDPKEGKRISDLWDERSKYSDTAHPSPFDEAERYPNQFPIPSNVRYSGSGFDSVAPNIILKYFQYIKGIFTIDIDDTYEGCEEGSFSRVYTMFPLGAKNQNHFAFHTKEENKNILKNKLKKAFASAFKMPESSIAELTLLPTKNIGLKLRTFMLRVDTKSLGVQT